MGHWLLRQGLRRRQPQRCCHCAIHRVADTRIGKAAGIVPADGDGVSEGAQHGSLVM